MASIVRNSPTSAQQSHLLVRPHTAGNVSFVQDFSQRPSHQRSASTVSSHLIGSPQLPKPAFGPDLATRPPPFRSASAPRGAFSAIYESSPLANILSQPAARPRISKHSPVDHPMSPSFSSSSPAPYQSSMNSTSVALKSPSQLSLRPPSRSETPNSGMRPNASRSSLFVSPRSPSRQSTVISQSASSTMSPQRSPSEWQRIQEERLLLETQIDEVRDELERTQKAIDRMEQQAKDGNKSSVQSTSRDPKEMTSQAMRFAIRERERLENELEEAIRQSSEASKALKSIKQRVATARFEQEERSSFLEQQALVCDVDESRGDAFITEIENVKVQIASWEKKLSLLRDTVAFESQMFDQIAEEVNALSEASELQSALGPDLNELLRMKRAIEEMLVTQTNAPTKPASPCSSLSSTNASINSSSSFRRSRPFSASPSPSLMSPQPPPTMPPRANSAGQT